MGDEDHYLLRCDNNEMNIIRQNFICNIKKEIPQLQKFSEKNIDYLLCDVFDMNNDYLLVINACNDFDNS